MSKLPLVLAVLVSLVIVPGAAAADVTGTVTVADGSADGDAVTVAPLDDGFQTVADPVETTVDNGSFSYETVDNASMYYVRLEHDDTFHYALVSEGDSPTFTLNQTVSGDLVDENGSPVSNATINVTSQSGPPVDQVNASDDGTFTVGPLQPNREYPLRIQANGAVYNRTLTTGNDTEDVTFELPSPTSDRDVLGLGGGQPANHYLQVGPTNNGTGLFVIDVLSMENGADRPYVGDVEVNVPTDAEVVTAMVGDQRAPVEQANGTATVDASIGEGTTTEVAVFYRLEGWTVEKTVDHDVEQFAVAFAEYDLSQVEFSDNLVEGDAPIPIVTNDAPLEAGDQISVTVDSDRGDTMPGNESVGGSQSDDLPVGLLAAGFLAVVVGGLAAYRYL